MTRSLWIPTFQTGNDKIPVITPFSMEQKMIRSDSTRQKRQGTTAVEFAVVSIIALLFMFGIMEYARYVHMLQMVHNAAREGARFAVVSTGNGTTESEIIAEVQHRMAKRSKELSGFNVQVLNVDPDTGSPTGQPWDQAAFGTAISIRITGQYKPVLPNFLLTSDIINIDVQHMMSSEAN